MKSKPRRVDVTMLEHVPNVGPAIAADFVRLGIRTPRALTGRPWEDVARNDRLSLLLQLEQRS